MAQIIVPAQMPRKVPCALAFVGEAPGEDEELDGKPLVGPSGNIYNGLLRAANIDRRDVYTGNVFDRKAEGNDVEPWMKDPAIYGPAIERLKAELEAVQPTVIVPMGNTALWALTGDAAISQWRGAVSKAEFAGRTWKMVPTFHPAFVMRQWKYLPVVLGDFNKAVAEAKRGPEVVLPRRRFWLEPTLDDLEKLDSRVRESDLLSVDIETGWGQITCIGFGWTEEEAVCVPFVDLRKPSRSYWADLEEECIAWRFVKRWLESDAPKVGQNYGAYDALWLLECMGCVTKNLLNDTRLLHHALYPELPKDLGFMSGSYSAQGVWKTWSQSRTEKRDD